LVFLAVGDAMRAAPVRLARHPDYHAGKIAFSYLGDIWVANEDGTNVQRLTDNRAREAYPRFLPMVAGSRSLPIATETTMSSSSRLAAARRNA